MKLKKVLGVILLVTIFSFCINIVGVSAENIKYDNFNESALVSCGGGYIKNIPAAIPNVISIIYTIIQIAVPVVLVVMGTLDLFKGISANKEDEMKKGQQMFIKRLLAAALVFFAFAIVKIVISFVADDSEIMECAECFVDNKCDSIAEKNDEGVER